MRSLIGLFGSGMINQDISHEPGGKSKKLRSTLTIDLRQSGKAQICFMDKGGGLQGVACRFVAKLSRCNATQLRKQ